MLKYANMNRKYILFISILVSFFSCKSMEQSFDDYKGKIITIGYGGGFTGEYKEYSLLENGDMFLYNTISKKRKYLGKVEKNVVDQMFENSKMLNLPKVKFNKPGNMNKYIVFRINKVENKILWSNDKDINNDLSTFYKVFLNNVKKYK